MRGFAVDPGWRVLWHDLGVRVADVLRRAGLPEDLLAREGQHLAPADYFRLWRALESMVAPPLPLRLIERYAVEAFQPPLFAALCSPDLRAACGRLATYKRLIGPMALQLGGARGALTVSLRFLDTTEDAPEGLVLAEFAFIVRLARLGTRNPVCATRVALRSPPPRDVAEYERFFGVRLERAASDALSFSADDAAQAFLTSDERMWAFFEPELRRRMGELDAETTTTERARSALLELLPSGRGTLEDVARTLAMSPRTLQRQLQLERSPFQQMRGDTRRELALYYLRRTNMQLSEISFLLGYTNPNSFFRAFHAWTGLTPGDARRPVAPRERVGTES
jgi:AraC-like DNA-binding protein